MAILQRVFFISSGILSVFLMIHTIQKHIGKGKKAPVITEEYTKILRVCVLSDNDDNTVSVKIIDLEKSKYIVINLLKSHNILEQADDKGLVIARCHKIDFEETYPDIPEIAASMGRQRDFGR